MEQTQDDVDWVEAHGIIMKCAWFFFQNVALWSLNFKSYRYAIFIHIACMSCAAFLMAIGPIMMIVTYGPSVILRSIFHQLWGFILYLTLPFLLLSGAICKISKDQPYVKPQTVYFRNTAHNLFGWIFIILVKVPLLTGWYNPSESTNAIFIVILVVSPTSYFVYLFIKFFKMRMQAISINFQFTSNQIRQIKSAKDLRIYSQKYFIFANYVYDISTVLINHPGGFQIIQKIRGRQVDRFIYGVDPIQLYDVPKISHTSNSINLAGKPIAVLKIHLSYSNLQQLNKVKIQSISCHDKNMMIHCIYFSLKENQFSYSGYQHLSQIGQYYSLTINEKFTRLYTAVNFLQPQNIRLIIQLAQSQFSLSRKQIIFQNPNKIQQNQQQMMKQHFLIGQKSNSILQSRKVLPLLIKKYDDGKFTSQFLQKYNNQISSIILSQPRGLGLCLDCKQNKSITLFAGGTGLYPFSDLIDLLFKSKIAEQKPELTNIIFESDPLLKQKPFEGLKYKLYLALNQLQQLHPLTLYQCNVLSAGNTFSSFVKLKNPSVQQFRKQYKNIKTFSDRFEKLIQKQLQNDPQTYFCICGPVRFTRALVNQLNNLNVPSQNYKIV